MATAENKIEINEVIRKLEKTVTVFSKRDRKGLLIKAAAPVRKTLRINTKKRKRKRGSGKRKVGSRTYSPGNLRRSMKRLTKLKRSSSVFVGPDYGKKAKPNADGYYYAMAYADPPDDNGKRANALNNYRRELLFPSAQQSESASIRAFRKDFAKRFGTRAAQQGLDVS